MSRPLRAVVLAFVVAAALPPGATASGETTRARTAPSPATAGTTTGSAEDRGRDHDAGVVDHHGLAAASSGAARSGHQQGEGLPLAAQEPDERRPAGGGCARGAPVRRYDVVAIGVDITVNRYLDHDPEGRMYALEGDVERVRAEERRNEEARATGAEPAVSVGLQGDAIQPLTLRARPGECLRVRLRNALPGDEAASFHLHGGALVVAGTNIAAVAAQPRALARPGSSVTYEWAIGAAEPEGTHYFHSHGATRVQTGHGLFGAVIVEPAGSQWSDPLTGEPAATGWAATVRTAGGSDFRESVVYYHEIGHENYQLRDRAGGLVPLVDPITSAYRPGARALNYRSEPFSNRLALQHSVTGRPDVSLAYSSYAFGDPATPMARSYVGDPVKQRVVHAGSEVFHVHHVHGGAVRWRRQVGVDDNRLDSGLDKRPQLRVAASERTDSQSIGPSETFDVEHECGAGGCQQSAGDFMYHCHVSHHYFAGMWSIWRVYNTAQDGKASTDSLPPLLELPDRAARVKPAVEAVELAGTTVDWSGRTFRLEDGELAAWVERQLPPPGVPRGYDASVMDWARDGDRFLNEPETERVWPGYRARAPGTRPPITFDPVTGKLAYPLLRPHLGRRPPFAPNHGPAPFLDPVANGRPPPEPGASGPASLCPSGTERKDVAINAVPVPLTLNARAGRVDPAGQLFVLRSERDAVLRDASRRVPLTIRANAGETCIDVLLRSELEDNADDPLSKVDVHVHFVQFDVQGSDGVDTGFGYEQAVRPFRLEGEVVAAPVAAGATTVRLGNADRFQAGAVVGVGMDRDETFEVGRIAAVSGPVVTFDEPLRHAHTAGEVVSAEFVRYRWYPDAQVGPAFFHEHVNPLNSARHGLFGALVVEPPGASYHHPVTGEEIDSGTVADVHSTEPLSVDVSGSFRELVLFIQDDNPLSREGRSTGSAYNLRVEPVERRGRDPARRFSSREHGDPETPVVQAYLGDPVVFRSLVGANNEMHTLHLDGHWFRTEAASRTSKPTSTAHLGISERLDLVVPAAGGPQRMPGDYLYYSGRTFKLREGSWGLLRVRDRSHTEGLRRLPGREEVPEAATEVCPPDAPGKRFAVSAMEAPLAMLGGTGKIYVLGSNEAAVASGWAAPQPLVLHVNVGDCITVDLSNRTGGPVSFHADMLAFDPDHSAGVAAGRHPPQLAEPGMARTYTFYASPEVGETVALVRDWADVLVNPGLGLYGAIVVGPKDARFRDPYTGADASRSSLWRVDVVPPSGPAYREFTLFFQDDDEGLGNHRMPYTTEVRGAVGVNYSSAPLGRRLASNADEGSVLSSAVHGDPATPVLEAVAGDPVRINVLAPWSEQSQVFSVEGHRWPVEPGRDGSALASSVKLGGLEALTVSLDGGAGGTGRLAGDYVYGNHREPYREAGQWGVLRVRPSTAPTVAAAVALRALPCEGAACPAAASAGLAPSASVGALGALVALGVWSRRRRDRPRARPPGAAPFAA
ncbi:MAG TPA: multicopper oxidase domain-containing protein [Acidimicrobiales bacterium]|nr:multicopper oxidase domain-containing protein [Acidimicrobiales bacterium]